MRPITQAEQNLMMSDAGCTTWLRVRLLVGTVDVDLSSVRGHDWLLDASWTATLDAPVGTATVTLRRFVGPDEALTLSPQVVSSPVNSSGLLYDPLLREGRTIRIDCMVVPLGHGKVGTWRESFYGRVEDVSVEGATILLTCRDMAGILQDVVIKEERDYGSATVGVAVQVVMNQILSAEGLGAFGPYCPVDPMWQLGRFTQGKMPVMDALQDLAGQLGWDLRLRWRVGHGFALTLAEPERTTTTPVWWFGPEAYEDLDGLARRLTDIRNAVRVVYADANDRDAAGNGKRKMLTEVNSVSIAEYGERWSEIVEASTSNINTEAEARRLARAFINDMSEPALEVTVTVALWWHLELGDFVQLWPDYINFDEPQQLAVQSIEHVFTADKGAATKLVLRGRPSTSRVAWLKREAVPGIGKAAPFTGPDAPTGLTVANTVNGGTVSFTPAATGSAWDDFELHLSSTSGFTPSSATYRGLSGTTRFDVTGLTPGTTYYARVRGRDAKGNLGPASSEVTLMPRYLAPVDLQPYVNITTLPPNGDFEALTDPTGLPDTWLMDVGTWGTDASVVSDALTGARALHLSTAGTAIRSQLMVVREGNRYGVDLYAKASSASTVFTVSIRWLNSAQAFFGESTVIQTAPPVGVYARLSGSSGAPLGARYARVVITLQNSVGPGRTLTVDSLVFAPLSLVSERPTPVTGTMFAMGGGGWANVGAPEQAAMYSKGLGEEVALEGAIRSGTIGGIAFYVPAGYRPSANIRCVTAAANGFARIRIEPTGAVIVESAPDSTRVHLDGARFVARG
ncbi:fibronectin type III domain-containing protein [Myxococcus sp. CA051A]|uniref:fibronectin type III domain-containing protein n=1 Tax=Myxococcus sp. CA051A TaxID=2741739 RepID=UPI00157AFAD1|nr:fibronectin type III domain-containing protein [Myxococcus sp. CA051A]NTX59568.1 fibronectin type III domain-containing protein [Myxococcus sp. CA051A]